MAKQPGLDNRSRDNDRQTSAKNGNARVDTLRQTYGDDFAEGVCGDAHLSTVQNRSGSSSLSAYQRSKK
jgi:hypothetical protein